jgi:hypothetical protein
MLQQLFWTKSRIPRHVHIIFAARAAHFHAADLHGKCTSLPTATSQVESLELRSRLKRSSVDKKCKLDALEPKTTTTIRFVLRNDDHIHEFFESHDDLAPIFSGFTCFVMLSRSHEVGELFLAG